MEMAKETALDFARYEQLCELVRQETPTLARARRRILDSIAAEAGNSAVQQELDLGPTSTTLKSN
jgi:hypothetical protein